MLSNTGAVNGAVRATLIVTCRFAPCVTGAGDGVAESVKPPNTATVSVSGTVTSGKPAAVPRILTLCVPNAALVPTVKVSDDALKTTGFGVNVPVTPAGRLSTTSVIGASKLLRSIPSSTSPVPPGATVAPVVAPVIEYVPTAVIVRANVAVTDVTPVPDAVTVSG